MDLQRLEEFVIIAQSNSLKEAASKMKISTSTLSSRINAFEKCVGTSLFERSSSIHLTDAGKRFYQIAIDISENYSSIRNKLHVMNSFTEYSHIRIGAAGGGLPFYLGPFLDIINKRQSDIKIDLLNEFQYSIKEGILNDEIDFYMAPVMNQVTYPDIIRHPLYGAHQYITLPLTHPLSSKNEVSIFELNNETFLLHPNAKENCIRDFQFNNLEASGIRFSVYDTESSESLYNLLVPIGKGLLISPLHRMDPLPNCITLPLRDLTYSAPISIFYRKNNIRPEVHQFVTEFIQFVKESLNHDH